MDVADSNFSINPDNDEIIAWAFPVPGRRREGVWSFGKPSDSPTADELKDDFEPVLEEELSNALEIEAQAAYAAMSEEESDSSQA